MLTMQIAEISEHAGAGGDGIVRGAIPQQLLTGQFNNFEWQEQLWAIRKDVSESGYVFTDISAEAVSNETDACVIWGDTAHMSATDCVYIAADDVEITELRVVVSTRGVWTGTGLAVYDSHDGITAGRLLTIVEDGSDGFRNPPGVYVIRWEKPATPGLPFSPVPGDIASRRWIVLGPVGLTGVTTAPKLSMIFTLHGYENAPFLELTDLVNAPMDEGFTDIYPDMLTFENSVSVFVTPELPIAFDLMIYRRAEPDSTDGIIEYLASNGQWKTLPEVNDGSNGFQNGPATLSDPPLACTIKWSVPSDWITKTVTFPLLIGGTKTVSGYFSRYRVTAVNTIVPLVPSLARARCRVLSTGYAEGMYHFVQTAYHAVTFEIGVPADVDTVVQLTNPNTKQGVIFTIPSGVASSSEITGLRADLSDPLSVGAGESLLVAWLSGGTVRDVELVLQ